MVPTTICCVYDPSSWCGIFIFSSSDQASIKIYGNTQVDFYDSGLRKQHS